MQKMTLQHEIWTDYCRYVWSQCSIIQSVAEGTHSLMQRVGGVVCDGGQFDQSPPRWSPGAVLIPGKPLHRRTQMPPQSRRRSSAVACTHQKMSAFSAGINDTDPSCKDNQCYPNTQVLACPHSLDVKSLDVQCLKASCGSRPPSPLSWWRSFAGGFAPWWPSCAHSRSHLTHFLRWPCHRRTSGGDNCPWRN